MFIGIGILVRLFDYYELQVLFLVNGINNSVYLQGYRIRLDEVYRVFSLVWGIVGI